MSNKLNNMIRYAIAISFTLFIGLVYAEDNAIIVQSTTSTENSGLYRYLLPLFTQDTGIKVHVVAVGTGQAIKNAMRGDADVLLVHARAAERQFIADGWGIERYDLMYNDFIIIGPSEDPAKVAQAKNIKDVLQRIMNTESIFVSRGDNSGTHKKELQLWSAAHLDPKPYSGAWYRESGSSMGATINTAIAMNGYSMSDRATWLTRANKKNFRTLFEGAAELFNQYGVIAVNPEKYPHVKRKEGQKFIEWLLSDKGQRLIAEFKIGDQQLFFPNAHTR